jgi:hypothetical protein
VATPLLPHDDYRFFGINIRVMFDSPTPRDDFRCIFSNLLVDPHADTGEPGLIFTVLSRSKWGDPAVMVDNFNLRQLNRAFTREGSNVRFSVREPEPAISDIRPAEDDPGSENPVMTITEQVCVIHDRTRWLAHAESIVFHAVLTQIPDYTAMHAGVISYNDKGIIICGETGKGKSTLTLALVQLGFRFLSDEVALISQPGHQVVPFPRALGVRKGALSMFPNTLHADHLPRTQSMSGDDKWLVNPSNIVPGSLGTACPVKYILLLEGFSRSARLTPLPASEALFRCLKFTHTGAEDPFHSVLSVASVVHNATSYLLHPGDVHETAAAILDMAR